jgi:hypothetical protein
VILSFVKNSPFPRPSSDGSNSMLSCATAMATVGVDLASRWFRALYLRRIRLTRSVPALHAAQARAWPRGSPAGR